jgi:hypothetical protein
MTLDRDSRNLLYGLLITIIVGVTLGRLIGAERVNEPSVHKVDGSTVPRPAWPKERPNPWPTFSSNDRSRWAMVRALVEEGTFVVGKRDPVTGKDSGIIFEDGWQSVDKVLHPVTNEFYSSKPPLLSVLVAAEYWLLRNVLGWDIVKDRWPVMVTILITINILPLILYLWLLAALADRFAKDDWSRFFIVIAGGLATVMTPFLITFNNHTIATTSVLLALWATLKIRDLSQGGSVAPVKWFLLAGFAAGFAACMELPALALTAGLGVYLILLNARATLSAYLPSALLCGVALLACNYAELGQLRPAYAEFGGPWYQYEGSHWKVPEGTKKRGIDFAGVNGETKTVYTFHLLVGHHGWFSLTPIMFLGLIGMIVAVARSKQNETASEPDNGYRLFALFSLLVSVVVIGFYIYKSDNYGGWSNGPRWLMWLSPMWLLCMSGVLDQLAKSRAGRMTALTLLALSMMSMNYQGWNPWRHPWLYNWLETRGWIDY